MPDVTELEIAIRARPPSCAAWRSHHAAGLRVDSAMWDFLDDEARESMREEQRRMLPARRGGHRAGRGGGGRVLMSSPYVTGTVLEVNGGQLLV